MHNFSKAKINAINELNEMHKRASKNSTNTQQNRVKSTAYITNNTFKKFNLNLSDDDIVIIGLFLILSKDCNDIWLFLSLLYILM